MLIWKILGLFLDRCPDSLFKYLVLSLGSGLGPGEDVVLVQEVWVEVHYRPVFIIGQEEKGLLHLGYGRICACMRESTEISSSCSRV